VQSNAKVIYKGRDIKLDGAEMKIWRILLFSAFLTLFLFSNAHAQGMGEGEVRDVGIALAAALSLGLACLGAGYAIAHASSAVMGAVAEKSELFAWGLVLVALAEGVALYGLVIAFILVGKL
jgi:V/A-type H+-transporting ATPase subunit K